MNFRLKENSRILSAFLILISLVVTFFFAKKLINPKKIETGQAAVNQLPVFPLKLLGTSKNRYLAGADNKPFFMNGEAAWSLIIELSREDALVYLDDRSKKGFNLALVNLIEHRYSSHPPSNYYNDAPFTAPGNFDTPNEAYFAHADWVIQRANERGIAVLLDPIYLGYQCNSDGWCAEIKNSSITTMRNWGRYVGNRYKNFPNIIWLIGGDEDPTVYGVADKIREVALGINETDPNHLMTAHNSDEQAALDVWPNESWLDLNNVYTYFDAYPFAQKQYSRSNFKPFFLLETAYENWNNSTPTFLRSQAYWTVLSGGILGHIYGNCQIWGFSRGYCTDSWKNQLNSEGSRSLALVGSLFNSREFYNLVPDQSIIVSKSGSSFVSAARTTNGHTMIIYSPSQMTLGINLGRLGANSVKAWWFNPRDGTASLIGNFSISANQSFTPPSIGDWVLVIDDAFTSFPPPGGISPTNTVTPSITAALKPGDVNKDGRVDILDFQLLSNSFGKSSGQTGFNTDADFNKDNVVNILDFQILSNNFGK